MLVMSGRASEIPSLGDLNHLTLVLSHPGVL